jgi:16S rRNA (uracil1498-N3)-methyltransferase
MSRTRSRGQKPKSSRVYAPDAARDRSTVRLPADEAHHLMHVLRMAVGDAVGVFDGAGREWSGCIVSADRSGVAVELVAPIDPVPEPVVHIVLAIGLLKGDQMDAVVRDATMLGVAEIVPMVTARVAVSGHARDSGKAVERWTRVAIASARQCGRAVVPRIAPVTPFETVVAQMVRDVTIIAIEPALADLGTNPPYVRPKRALVLVGPEGGWSAAEVESARKSGAHARQLGPRTLRAESAPIVLLSSLWTEWGWT